MVLSNEIDRRIAIEIMGEPEPPPVTVDRWGSLYLDGKKLKGGILPWGSPACSPGGNWTVREVYGEDYTWRPMRFSSRLELAELALDKYFAEMHPHDENHYPEMFMEYRYGEEDRYFVEILDGRHDANENNSFAYTLPEAICKLLLALKEVAS